MPEHGYHRSRAKGYGHRSRRTHLTLTSMFAAYKAEKATAGDSVLEAADLGFTLARRPFAEAEPMIRTVPKCMRHLLK
jgi:hypothetical protein